MKACRISKYRTSSRINGDFKLLMLGIGCGPRGNAATMSYGAHPRTDIVGLSDVFPEKLAEVGDRAGLPASVRFSDYEKMIREKIELISRFYKFTPL